ncbi:MAG: putative Ig domain-containing protein, partial [Verrucomicrobiota bacterium]
GGTGMILGDFRLPLSKTGGTIALIKPGATPDLDVVLDEVTYSNRLPWAVEAAGAGPSLQLIDPTRDNSRVGNWTTGSPFTTSAPQSLVVMTNSWKFFEQGDPGAVWNELGFDDGAWAPGQALLYVENANLPAAKNTPLALGQMAYYFRTKFNFNGNPEGTTFKLTTIIDDGAVFYLNGKELYRLGMSPGDVVFATPSGRTVGDAAMEGPFTIQTNLLRQGENVFAVEVHQPGASSDIVMGAALEVIEVQRAGYTPLTENSVRANIPEFPMLWINEVLPQNTAGLADGQGEREPWIELYNSGPTPIPLGGLYLTDNYAALTRWAFPPDVVIQPGQFLLVWADGESGESSAAELHTNFRLNATSGSIALARLQNGKPAVVDYIDYAGLNADMSFGSIPDGQSQLRQAIVAPTPNSANQNEPINRAPTLGSILNQQILTGQTLTVQLTATDPDPGQTLRFELVEGPAGAALDSGSGLLSWTPTQAQIGQFTFTLRATDNGSPPLSDSRSFNVTVTKPAEDLRIIEVTRLISGGVRLTWTSEPQRTYRVQYASTVPTATWTPLGAAITATGATASFEDNPGDHAVRFYRIVAE